MQQAGGCRPDQLAVAASVRMHGVGRLHELGRTLDELETAALQVRAEGAEAASSLSLQPEECRSAQAGRGTDEAASRDDRKKGPGEFDVR